MSLAHHSEASTSHFQATATSHKDSKHRTYVSAVDKALKSFENSTEWADLIAALGKLGKVFSTNGKLFNDIPNSVTVAKRLSQCLHPLLPSGVHLKALETYRQVFLILGRTENLPRYLYLFAIGLFPLMDHCGIKVKSELLNIFEQLLLPLGACLRPALPGFIAAVLLGLEEGTEFYDRSSQLLEQLIEKVGAESFYACFWQAVHGSASVRLPALMFLNTKLDKRKTITVSQMSELAGGSYPNHMITALCAVAEDSGSTLIQRHLLDLLSTLFPLNNENTPQSDLVKILQRCIFVVLRRDMSLNRRLYQWILNRLNDSTFASHPVNGVENADDIEFLKTYSIPLIKLAIEDFLKVDFVEVSHSDAIMNGTLRPKDAQIQFVEVRVCRLMHYLLDRREVGILVLREVLATYLEFASQRDSLLIQEFDQQCEELDPSYESLWELSSSTNEQYRARRIEDTKKTFNSLLNSLESDFLWDFLGSYFVKLLDNLEEAQKFSGLNEGDETFFDDSELHLKYFPLIVIFCLKNVQLDSHGDIRARFLTGLLKTILSQLHCRGCDFICRDIFVAILVVARRLLHEINQNVSVFEAASQDESRMGSTDDLNITLQSPTKKIEVSRAHFKEECIEGQRVVESCLQACFELLSDVCKWYISGRDRNKTGVLCSISALIRDFSDFPIYCFQYSEGTVRLPVSAVADISRSKDDIQPMWLSSLIDVVSVDSWVNVFDMLDFDVRSRIFDLILYLYVRSISVIDQHLAVFGRYNSGSYYPSSMNAKTTTTVLLKSFFSERDLQRLESDRIFRKAALVLWTRLDNYVETFNLQTVAFLLLRIHSRKIADSSSEVEDIIVSELTSADKTVSGLAAKKFRDLWVFCRTAGLEDVYVGVPLKSMNRVVMVMLGFIADDLVGIERIELRAIAYAWFIDCSRHNDLYKILQMLLLMLVNPATARVSIQFVQVDSRITREQVSQMPREANSISLSMKNGGKQKFHHVCRDIDVRSMDESTLLSNAPWNNFSFIDCNGSQQWVSELNKLLLLPTTNFAENSLRSVAESTVNNIGGRTTPAGGQAYVNNHKRTVSDIPQFDEDDAESVGSFSMDSTMEHEIFDVIQFIVDAVVEDEVSVRDNFAFSNRLANTSAVSQPNQRPCSLDSSNVLNRSASSFSLQAGNNDSQSSGLNGGDSLLVNTSTNNALNQSNGSPSLQKRNRNILEKHRGSTSSERDQLHALRPSLPDSSRTIKHVKTGHRRQDSLQESIFNMNTQELRLFDPSELPSSTCPGDAKQPLLDETHSHMLFYTESPRIVDLGRAEKIFRTICALLKSGFSLGQHVVNCLIFTNTSHLKANGSSQLIDYMIRHYKHMQNGGFWLDETDLNGSAPPIIPGSDKNRNMNPTMFEILSTILLYYIRSYYLNSPTNYVSKDDLIMSWKCKIAALDCFTEMLKILNDVIKEVNSKEFVSFVQQIYRFTKTQRAVVALMLAAVPSPPSLKDWRMPITTDIAEFNNGPQNQQFKDSISAYYRSLLNLAFSLLVLEYNMQMGVKNFTAQSLGFSFERLIENRQLYNSPANRSTIRDSRLMVVELRLFIGVVLNALMRCPERHELWLQFLISSIPYLDRALPTFVVHVVEQICRNIYTCINSNNDVAFFGMRCQSPADALDSPRSGFSSFNINELKSAFYFVDFRIPKKDAVNGNNGTFSNDTSRMSSLAGVKNSSIYPANYAVTLMESLMSILHFCMIDSAAVSMPFLVARTSNIFTAHSALCKDNISYSGQQQYAPLNMSLLNSGSFANSGVHSGSSSTLAVSGGNASGGGTGGGSSNMVGSMVGSAISVIPGTTAISNLFGKVFTSSDSGNHANTVSNADSRGVSEYWLTAQKELLKIFPSSLAILCDVWSFAQQEFSCNSAAIGNSDALTSLIVDILNPIAKKHTNALINAFSVAWISRQKADSFGKKVENFHQPSFVYSMQQIKVAKLLLSLKVLSLNSIIIATAEVLREFANNKSTKVFVDKSYLSEVALLEILHECIRQVSVNDLKESWAALQIFFNDSPLSLLSARAIFLEFMIFFDFVHRCGSQAITDDRQISRAVLDVCQRLTDAVNSVIGWQLETTTWLKRTLVVRQDAGSQKVCDISPTMDPKNSIGLNGSDFSSIRGSTMSLVPSNRISSVDGVSQFNGSVAQLSLNSSDTAKKSASTLRSSLKDSNKKDPTDSTQALFLLADNLAELVDSICKNEDKEKLLPTLQAVWGNTLPYLKAKNAKNVRFFLAGSQFLASMSSFNYMRPVWKKAAMELLLDPSFFKMDIHALRQWLIVIDNLMTNDKISFKELIARITTGTSTTLSNLITSKEQEYEMRAQSMKRLAFVILSSEIDQYSAQLNEIQERLSENLRLSQVPVVHVQVFTCYRVLLVRMRPSSFVSMWPSMVTELVQVLSQMEQQLEIPIGASNRDGAITEDLKCSRDDHWMQLYLAACKLLETLCTLPCGYMAQFQMCRWAFVSALNSNSNLDVFVPFAVRINNLLSSKYSDLSTTDREIRSASLFNVKTLTSFQELHPFFYALATQHATISSQTNLVSPNGYMESRRNAVSPCSTGTVTENESQFRDANFINGSLTLKNAVARIEQALYVDFADHWQL